MADERTELFKEQMGRAFKLLGGVAVLFVVLLVLLVGLINYLSPSSSSTRSDCLGHNYGSCVDSCTRKAESSRRLLKKDSEIGHEQSRCMTKCSDCY